MQKCKSIHIKYDASALPFCIKQIGYNGTGKVVSLHDIKAYGRSTVTASLILNLSTKWSPVVNFMHWLLYPDKELWHLLNCRLYILQRKPGHCGGEKNLWSPPGCEPWIILAL
jgi:hypothetical protein